MLQTLLLDIRKISEISFTEAYSLMSPERRKSCDGYFRENDKKLCIAGDMALRKLLSDKTGIAKPDIIIRKTSEGKPYTELPGLYIGLSHSGVYAAAAVSDTPVGIDIEENRTVKPSVTRHFCNEREKIALFGNKTQKNSPADMLTGERQQLFFEIWTFKEAYYKCYGFPEDFTKVDFFSQKKQLQQIGNYTLCLVTAAL